MLYSWKDRILSRRSLPRESPDPEMRRIYLYILATLAASGSDIIAMGAEKARKCYEK
jgi:hypothetical protein